MEGGNKRIYTCKTITSTIFFSPKFNFINAFFIISVSICIYLSELQIICKYWIISTYGSCWVGAALTLYVIKYMFWMKTKCHVVLWLMRHHQHHWYVVCVGIFWWMTITPECWVFCIWTVYAIGFNTCTCTHWDKCDKRRLVNCWIISSVMENQWMCVNWCD